MSVDILGTSWDQCQSMVQYCFTSTETRRIVRTDSPGRPPQLSHSSWTMIFFFFIQQQPVIAGDSGCSCVPFCLWRQANAATSFWLLTLCFCLCLHTQLYDTRGCSLVLYYCKGKWLLTLCFCLCQHTQLYDTRGRSLVLYYCKGKCFTAHWKQ